MDATVEVSLRPSATALRWLFWVHLLPLGMLPFAVSSPIWLVGIALAIGVSWMWCRRHRALGFGRGAIVRVAAHHDGRWTIGGASGEPVEAELLGSSVMAGQFMVLNFRLPSRGRRSRILFGDETSAEGMRRLRARVLSEKG